MRYITRAELKGTTHLEPQMCSFVPQFTIILLSYKLLNPKMGFINLDTWILCHTLSCSLAVFNNNSGRRWYRIKIQIGSHCGERWNTANAIADSVEQGVTVVLEMVLVLSPPMIHMNYFLEIPREDFPLALLEVIQWSPC